MPIFLLLPKDANWAVVERVLLRIDNTIADQAVAALDTVACDTLMRSVSSAFHIRCTHMTFVHSRMHA